MAHILQDTYSHLVDLKLRASLVKASGVIFNTRYEGDPKAGVVKIPVRDTETAVAAYSRTEGTELTHGSTSYLSVLIDKDYAVNELIDSYDALAVPDDLIANRLDSAAYSLALQMERDASAELVAKATSMTSTAALTAATVYDAIVDARTKLSAANVPAVGRFLLVTPEVYALLLKDTAHFIHASAGGDNVLASGAVGHVAGFAVYEDNTLTQADAKIEFLAGHPDWCCRIEAWQSPVQLTDLKGSGTFIGASAVQGRKIYAHAVTKAAALVKKAHA